MSAKPTALGGPKPMLAGGAVGIPLATGLQVLSITDKLTGSNVITATRPCVALIYLQGAGASGPNNGGDGSGGGGGAALFKQANLAGGDKLNWAVGAGGVGASINTDGHDGGDTTVTFQDGRLLVAGGGKAGVQSVAGNAPGGLGGIATGGGVNRNGGQGGAAVASVGASGAAGTGGGAGGAGATSAGGGGGAAGFSELGDLLGGAGAAGNSNATASAPGGGNGAGTGVVAGPNGRVLIWLVLPS